MSWNCTFFNSLTRISFSVRDFYFTENVYDIFKCQNLSGYTRLYNHITLLAKFQEEKMVNEINMHIFLSSSELWWAKDKRKCFLISIFIQPNLFVICKIFPCTWMLGQSFMHDKKDEEEMKKIDTFVSFVIQNQLPYWYFKISR